MKTPLPEKLGDKPAKDDESGLVYEVMNNQDQIITYLAELTKVVDGKQDKFTLKESIFGDSSTASAETPAIKESTYADGYKQALADVRSGVPGEKEDHPYDSDERGWNQCRTAVLEHLDLLGSKE